MQTTFVVDFDFCLGERAERAQHRILACTVVAAFFFFFFVNENETETKRKRSINGVFEKRFEFFRNVLTFSQ